MKSHLLIHPLSPDRLPDYLTFFDGDALAITHWAFCYCHFYLADHRQKPWERAPPGRTRPRSASASPPDACRDTWLIWMGVVAWCHAGLASILNLQQDEQLTLTIWNGWGDRVLPGGACLPPGRYRSQPAGPPARAGTAGLAIAEAYPRRGTASDAANYHGPLQMFLEAGFEPYREYQDFVIARKRLV
jgi:hypothetical protein